MLNKVFRLGLLLSTFALGGLYLGGCGNDSMPCASNAECLTGQVCSNGACVPQAAGGSGNTAGVGGSIATAGAGGSANPTAGSAPGGAGGVGTAGMNPGVSGSGNSSGSGNVSGSGNGGNGGASQGGAGGASGGGSGGSAGSGNVVGMCKDDYWPAANNGSVTRYDFKQGTALPACAYQITHTGSGSDGDWDTVEGISTGDGGYFGAMNTTDYKNGAACGACVEASYNGRKVLLTIVDECPVGINPLCQKGHIDLSRKAIRQLEPNGSLENLKNVSWHYVKCPAAGNVKVRLHPNQNPDWQPVVIENGLYPIKSVTLNGATAKRTGNTQEGNAWIADGKKAPYIVRAVDVNENAIQFEYAGGSGLKDAGLQFMCK
jgi:expansin (peptidoglycan-binding protein)